MSSKPTIIMFPGAFHPASCLDKFMSQLQAAGFKAESDTMLSYGDASKTMPDDEKYMQSVIASHADKGEDVVFIVHSFSGFPGTGAASGMDKKSREARGEKGGLVGLIYIAAFVPTYLDSTTASMRGSAEAETWSRVNLGAGLLDTVDHYDTFFNDCNPEEAEAVSKTLKGHSLQALTGSPSAIGYRDKAYDGRRGYIFCENDHAIPVTDQRRFVAASQAEWITRSMDTSHSPFLSVPAETAKVVSGLVDEFLAAA